MPLTEKGKKLKAKFRGQYGKKKGDSIFYAMENSGKLKKSFKSTSWWWRRCWWKKITWWRNL